MCSSTKSGLPNGTTIRVLPARISYNWDRSKPVPQRADFVVNQRISTETNPSFAKYPNQYGPFQQASVRVRKRKSCVTFPRSKQPGILLGIGAGKLDAQRRLHETPMPSFTPLGVCKKRVEFTSQPRLDKINQCTGGTPVPGVKLPRETPEPFRPSSLLSDKDSNRYHVFSYQQVKRLNSLLQTQLCISPRPIQWDCGLVPGLYPDYGRCFAGPTVSCHVSNGNWCPAHNNNNNNPKHSPSGHQARHGDNDLPNGMTGPIPDSMSRHEDQSSSTPVSSSTHKSGPRLKQANARVEPVHCLPVIRVQLKQLIRTIRDRLLEEQVVVREIRLNGGAAGCVISLEQSDSYSDLDVIFSVDLSNSTNFTKIKSVVFSSIAQFLADTFACGNLVYSCGGAAQNPADLPAAQSANSDGPGDRRSDPSWDKPPGQSPGNGKPETTGVTGSESAVDAANRPRTRCSLSFTSGADIAGNLAVGNHNASLTTSSSTSTPLARTIDTTTPSNKTTPNTIQTNRSVHNRRASDNSIPITVVPTDPCCDPTMMMMTLTSCFFCSPFHSFPCAQSWSRMLRDESMVKQYIQKMVRIHKPSSKTADSWSLFTLGYRTPDGGKTVDVKFVDRMQRPFEFTVDSFQIVLDSLMMFYETSRQTMDENFYPTVVAESVAGSFTEALTHLNDRLIVTPRPEEIRGGGLLKYCKLLVDGYRPSTNTDVLSMERYMCSRFFIDFPDIVSQHQRLTYYLVNHFDNNDATKATYLQILHEVVSHSTVCLMTHERQQTLCLIRMLLQDVLSRSEVGKTGVHLEEFSSDNWALDSIFYGTTYFPKQLYLLSDPVTMLPGTESVPSCLVYGEAFSPPTGSAELQNYSPQHQTEQCNDELNETTTPDQLAYDQSNAFNSENVSDTADPSTETTTHPKETVLDRVVTDESPSDPFAVDAMSTTTSCVHQNHSPCTNPYITVDSTACEDLPDQIMNSNCNSSENGYTELQTNPYLNSPLYYIPQVVTYFPTPVKYTKESEDVNHMDLPVNTDQCASADTSSSSTTAGASKTMPHYHAGIILPRIESTGTAEMNHYVGVPCSDMQYPSYPNYSNGLLDSADCQSLAPSMYWYPPDSGYLVYTNPVLHNSPTLILAYPM